LGLNKWRSPLDVWLEKTGRKEPVDLSDKPTVEWGLLLEDAIAKKFKACHPELRIEKPKGIFISEERPFMVANPDRLIRDSTKLNGEGVLEIKTTQRKDGWLDAEGNETVPVHFLAQVQHYMAVLGVGFAYFAVLVSGHEYFERYVERDDDDIAALVAGEKDFWDNYVVKDVMPALVGTEDESAALLTLYPEVSEGPAVLDLAGEDLAESYKAVSENIKELEAVKRNIADKLRLKVGDAPAAESEIYRVTWVRSVESRLDAKALKAGHPEIAEKYYRSVSRDGGIRITEKE
jgi:putative phage-type endonuclease